MIFKKKSLKKIDKHQKIMSKNVKKILKNVPKYQNKPKKLPKNLTQFFLGDNETTLHCAKQRRFRLQRCQRRRRAPASRAYQP